MHLALAEYERLRNEHTLPQYRDNLLWARFEAVTPEVLRLRCALRSQPAETTQFCLARYGRIPREAFFNASHLARILGAEARNGDEGSVVAVPDSVYKARVQCLRCVS